VPDEWATYCEVRIHQGTKRRFGDCARKVTELTSRIEGVEDFRDVRERQQLSNALYALETLIARKRSA
jgi:hypothetical protein